MPTYDYQCQACGEKSELIQKMTEEPVQTCPKCGGKAERVFSPGAGFLFKGSGFYITDHRSDSYKKKAKEESGAPAEKKSQIKAPKD